AFEQGLGGGFVAGQAPRKADAAVVLKGGVTHDPAVFLRVEAAVRIEILRPRPPPNLLRRGRFGPGKPGGHLIGPGRLGGSGAGPKRSDLHDNSSSRLGGPWAFRRDTRKRGLSRTGGSLPSRIV